MQTAELVSAFNGKRVLVTGHTGFKGAWLTLWLNELGANVTGYALLPDTNPAPYDVLGVADTCHSCEGDIRDLDGLRKLIRLTEPHFVFHLAAQPLVRRSHEEPLETFDVNVRGTATVLEALRQTRVPCAIVLISSDKCYENREWVHGYREDDSLGGHDPYSASKAATEIVAISYRRSFFAPSQLERHGVALATARAGNVIGGGDWAPDRILPDAVRALSAGRSIAVRNPLAVRPWQHVLEPLSGYLTLAAKLASGPFCDREACCEAWNFGPLVLSNRTVACLIERVVEAWGDGTWTDESRRDAPHEAGLLALSIDKAVTRLGWRPQWSFARTITETVRWYRGYYGPGGTPFARDCTIAQIRAYSDAMNQQASREHA